MYPRVLVLAAAMIMAARARGAGGRVALLDYVDRASRGGESKIPEYTGPDATVPTLYVREPSPVVLNGYTGLPPIPGNKRAPTDSLHRPDVNRFHTDLNQALLSGMQQDTKYVHRACICEPPSFRDASWTYN